MKKILVYFGTFNPMHNGHLFLLKKAIEVISPKKTIVVPSSQKLRKFRQYLANPIQRFKICKLMTEDLDNVEVSDFEVFKEDYVYTIDTINHLENQYKEYKLCLIFGSDSFLSLDYWKKKEEILQKTKIYVAVRKGDDIDRILQIANEYNKKFANIKLLDIDTLDISSSKTIADYQNNIINDYLPAKVVEYIKENNIF